MSQYRILGKLAEGGMGTVYRALQVELEREVALKTLLPALAQDEKVATRFRREVKLLCQLSHEHIVPIFDEGVLAGRPFFVMELVEGPPLDEVLKSAGPPPFEEVLALSIQLVDAVDYLHGRGIHHRDIKPKNVIVTEKGGKKHLILVDFGLARGASALTLTAPGEIVGTLPFLAPELLEMKEGGAPQDIWAIGVTLYQLVRGEMLFPGGQPANLIATIIAFEPESLPARLPGTPAWFVELIGKCLTREPGARITARALLERLQDTPRSAESILAAARAETHIPQGAFGPALDMTGTVIPVTPAPSVPPSDPPAGDPFGETPSTRRLEELVPGLRFGHLLGQGGMGMVHEAVKEASGERVAVKMILPRVLAHPDALARFKREADALLKIFSPRVVRLLDLGERDGWHFLVMEYLEGEDLRARLQKGTVPRDEALRILTGVAEGLAELHSHGIVHRDIKPANVFLTRNGPKILDMGLSRQLDVTSMTADGAFLGTPIYCPPEVIAQLPSGPSGDVFQFGALLFETLTGKQTFRRKEAAAELGQALRDGGADDASIQKVTKVFERCMRQDPEQRFPGGAELVHALRTKGPAPPARPAPPPQAALPAPAPTGAPATGGKIVKGLMWGMLLLMTVAAAITLAVLPEILRRSGV